jgi:hypothetical protein
MNHVCLLLILVENENGPRRRLPQRSSVRSCDYEVCDWFVISHCFYLAGERPQAGSCNRNSDFASLRMLAWFPGSVHDESAPSAEISIYRAAVLRFTILTPSSAESRFVGPRTGKRPMTETIISFEMCDRQEHLVFRESEFLLLPRVGKVLQGPVE